MSRSREESLGSGHESSHASGEAEAVQEREAAAQPWDRTRRLVYLHGFRSSPASFKAGLFRNWFEQHACSDCFVCPQIPAAPREAIAMLEHALQLTHRDVLVGSSLGGLYAHWLAEAHGCCAILLNPAVYPSRDLAHHIGSVQAWHSTERFTWRSEDVDALRDLELVPVTWAKRYLLIAATGDEVIDWRLMASRYADCSQIIIEGSNHALEGFEAYLDRVIRFALFCDLPPREAESRNTPDTIHVPSHPPSQFDHRSESETTP